MPMSETPITVANAPYHPAPAPASGEYVTLLGEPFYRIQHYDAMPPFFISVISGSDHWLFISTTGGLTAGRQNADHALFPYYTEDRVAENYPNTGSKTLLLVDQDDHAANNAVALWEPFTDRYHGLYRTERALYKNIPGTALVFEERNLDLGLTFRYAWRTSEVFGIAKTSWLINDGPASRTIRVVDGLQNLLPAYSTAQVQNEMSVLLDAYKRNELHPATGLGLYSLSSRLTDRAEPSESLRANTVWQVGLHDATYLLSSAQLDTLRAGAAPQPETDQRGRRGAYFVCATVDLAADETRHWHIVAEVDQDRAAVTRLIQMLSGDPADLAARLEDDITASSHRLSVIVGSADGLQTSNDHLSTAHHYANVMFNVMRGGIFANHYLIDTADWRAYVTTHHPALLDEHADFFDDLPPTLALDALRAYVAEQDSADLRRLNLTYLPLTFSRRHGDPSRPWNRFAINLRKPDGSLRLDFQGNWRDIFQNWEALAYAYPGYLDGMIGLFLNATTLDGYNPYRITRAGIDWETPEPGNPWANIGYWSDHQIIYLQKLLEAEVRFYPGQLAARLNQRTYTYANVPYRIKPYDDMLHDPFNTIEFDWDVHHQTEARGQKMGADGRLVLDANGDVVYTTFAEKLLNLLLAKLVNFVPGGGIWMNTQRPEWNDANNALVGKGISVVTLGYLRRYVAFVQNLLPENEADELELSTELHTLLFTIWTVFTDERALLLGELDDTQRKTILDALGAAGTTYRSACYTGGLSGETVTIPAGDLADFLVLTLDIIEHTLRANQRADGLYHAYNVLQLDTDRATIKHLAPMLEGQVSILSSGLLTPGEALDLLRCLRQSPLYRADQHSYILYPDRDLPGFLAKNTIPADAVRHLALVEALVSAGNTRLITRDVSGAYHFSGDLRNAHTVNTVLAELADDPRYADLAAADADALLAVFEQVFNHSEFTGRSGSFFAYEGLGSIYWHMVSKLLLAVQENVFDADQTADPALPALIDVYYDVRAGLGFNKTPDVYGAFPTDPYSHTPGGQGARQPGMTGMVKEEVITRLGELGVVIKNGQITFNPALLQAAEWLTAPDTLRYFDIDGREQQLDLPVGTIGFTFCQVPVTLQRAAQAQITLTLGDDTHTINGLRVPVDLSAHVFARDGVVRLINVMLPV